MSRPEIGGSFRCVLDLELKMKPVTEGNGLLFGRVDVRAERRWVPVAHSRTARSGDDEAKEGRVNWKGYKRTDWI